MLIHPNAFTKTQWAALIGAQIWACFISDYARKFLTLGDSVGEAEAFIGFIIWCLFIWWISKRYAAGWSVYWFAFALVSYAPFADMIDTALGGILGLKQ